MGTGGETGSSNMKILNEHKNMEKIEDLVENWEEEEGSDEQEQS
jgi:hypothetical protein